MSMQFLRRAAALTALAAAIAIPAQAGSSASSASSAGSDISGSISNSISGSSKSSNGDDKKVAAGQYRVIDVVEVAGKPGTTRLKLQNEGNEFFLDLPKAALAQRALPTGSLVQVNERPYGYEFAYADTRQAFFLALDDAWQPELRSHAI
jgi:hypothetical protein